MTFTLKKAPDSVDDAYAIGASNAVAGGGTLKYLSLAWNGDSTETVATPLVAGAPVLFNALRVAFFTSSSSFTAGHLIVSKALFEAIRTAVNAGMRLILTLTDGAASTVKIQCFTAIVDADPHLETISETLQTTQEKVLLLQQDVSVIKEILQEMNDRGSVLADQASDTTPNGKRSAPYRRVFAREGVIHREG